MTSVSTPANRQRARTRPPSPRFRTYAAGFLAAIVIAIFIAVFLQSPHQAAEAQTSTILVKNTEQATGTGRYNLTTGHPRAQHFTTGLNNSGYTLGSIGILFHEISHTDTAAAQITATLRDAVAGTPDTPDTSALCTLTDPAFTGSGLQTFDAPTIDPCPPLKPDTAYFVVIERVQDVASHVISLKATASTDQDADSATDWYIGDDRHLFGSSNTWSSIPSQPYLIEVTGTTLASYTVPLNWPLKPHGLVGGDQFRLLFVTSTTSDATSENIATYNTFVRTVAESGHDAIQAYSPGFTAIASAAATDARDNTRTTYTNDDKGVPIYWVGGANLAADYEDFYDGSWNNEDKAKDESGSVRSTTDVSDYPFTGSDHDGTERFAALVSEAMGSSNTNVAIGRPNSSTSGDGPLSGAMQTTAKTNSRPLYALSQVFTIDDAETTILETTITVESFSNVIGYSTLYGLGDIQDPSFSYKGRTGIITNVATSALEEITEFLLGIPGFFTDVDRDTSILTNWSLHVGDTTFADDAGRDHADGELYRWTQLPSTWNDTNVITIRLLTTEPSAPTSLTAVDNDPNGTTVTLTWTAPTTGGSAITKYQYRHSGIEPDTHSEWTDIPGGGTITTADVTFPVGWPDGPYKFNVRAFNDDGDGLWSEPAYATVFDERGLTVSNTSQTVNSRAYPLTDSSDLPSRAQQFTTGKNPAGYTLNSASAKFNSITNTGTVGAQLAVTLNANASGAPSSTALCTLTDPGTFATSGVHTFTAPTTDLCATLTPSTEYFIVVTRVEHVAADVIALDATASTEQDEASAANWTIGNSRHFYGSSNTWSSTASEPHLIAVTAKSLPNAPKRRTHQAYRQPQEPPTA